MRTSWWRVVTSYPIFRTRAQGRRKDEDTYCIGGEVLVIARVVAPTVAFMRRLAEDPHAHHD